jgi:NADH:ubiquinone oxidoreductase subunit 6 (subunit J)
MLVAIGLASSDRLSSPAEIDGAFGSPAEIGRLFLSDHLLAFEVTSIILLVAAVGGVVLAAAARNAQTEGSDPAEAVEG